MPRIVSPIVLLLAALLAGCTSLLDPRDDGRAPEHRWRGRFSLVVEPSAQFAEGQRHTGSFELSQGARFTELELLSPLGNTIASARETADAATLRTADGRRYDARDADALTEQIFGWRVPVRKLPDWLQGRIADVTEAGPSPAQPAAGADDGWRVRFDQWRTDGAAPRPSRLVITYPDRVVLRLIVDGDDNR
ncbi:MAG: outer membrane lipoprotein LolB [Burkholderiaceae bacterium]